MTVEHRSTASSAVIRALVALSLTFAAGACTTTDTKVRVVSRAGGLRDVVVVPGIADMPIVIDAGPDVATDEELALLQQQLPERLKTAIVSTGTSVGELDVVRVRVRAAPGREKHRTSVECRLRLKAGSAVVADVDATTLQLVQARNLSVVELEGIQQEMAANGGRNPLLALEDTEQAIVDACTAALHAIVDDRRPGDAETDRSSQAGAAQQARRVERSERRRRAVDRLEAAVAASPRKNDVLAASLVDIGETGTTVDAPPVAKFLYDDNALVRRAATSAFSSLCAGHTALGVPASHCVKPAPPPPAPPSTPAPAVEAAPTAEELARQPDDVGGPGGAEGEH
ncbi:MAG TPA: hypothetical protein VGF99_06695, partial [Myxococcota bacterium]